MSFNIEGIEIEGVWEIGEEFEEISDEIVDQGRWETYKEKIIKSKSSSNFYRLSYSEGSTECQDSSNEVIVKQVVPVEKMVTMYIDKA